MIKLFNDFILHSRIASGPPVDIWKATFIKELTTIGLEGLQHRADRGARFVLKNYQQIASSWNIKIGIFKEQKKEVKSSSVV